MREAKEGTQGLLSDVSQEQRIPQDRPLRAIRATVNRPLEECDAQFQAVCSALGRPSIPAGFLLRAILQHVFYSFVGLGMGYDGGVPKVFSKQRDLLLNHKSAQEFFRSVLEQASCQDLLAEAYFSVDGTLLEVWALPKSFQPKDPGVRQSHRSYFRGQTTRSENNASVSCPDARLYKNTPIGESRPAYLGHVLINHSYRHTNEEQVKTTDSVAEVDAAAQLAVNLGRVRCITIAADRGYGRSGLIRNLWDRNATARHVGYRISIIHVRRIESIFSWIKTVGGVRNTQYRKLDPVNLHFSLAATAHHLHMVRLGMV